VSGFLGIGAERRESMAINVLMAILKVTLAGGVSLIFKFLGEASGILIGPIVAQFYRIPSAFRWCIIALAWAGVFRASFHSRLVFVPTLLGLTGLVVSSLVRRYQSIETAFLITPLWIGSFATSLKWSALLFHTYVNWLCAASVIFAWFAYFLRVCSSFLISEDMQTRQSALDNFAEKTINSVLKGYTPTKFSVFLRPFDVTNKLGPSGTIPLDQVPFKFSRFFSGRPPLATTAQERFEAIEDMKEYFSDELEHIVARAAGPMCPLVALGKPGEALGAGRFTATDERWKQIVELLISKAALLIVVPSAHAGTIYELRFIVSNGLLSKTAFIMPDIYGYGEEWKAVQAAVGGDLCLPTYRNNGGVFYYDSAGHVVLGTINWKRRGCLRRLRKILRTIIEV
jgi:hypothetical protein